MCIRDSLSGDPATPPQLTADARSDAVEGAGVAPAGRAVDLVRSFGLMKKASGHVGRLQKKQNGLNDFFN
eukprot:2606482-Alexandrium_andersonii.AAC.1